MRVLSEFAKKKNYVLHVRRTAVQDTGPGTFGEKNASYMVENMVYPVTTLSAVSMARLMFGLCWSQSLGLKQYTQRLWWPIAHRLCNIPIDFNGCIVMLDHLPSRPLRHRVKILDALCFRRLHHSALLNGFPLSPAMATGVPLWQRICTVHLSIFTLLAACRGNSSGNLVNLSITTSMRLQPRGVDGQGPVMSTLSSSMALKSGAQLLTSSCALRQLKKAATMALSLGITTKSI